VSAREDEWLWGWDDTPGIVSVWAEPDGRALVWRRDGATGELRHEQERYRPFLLLTSLTELSHLGSRLRPEHDAADARITYQELAGEGALRYVVRAHDARVLTSELLRGASRRFNRSFRSLRELGPHVLLALPPEEQYLVATGRTYFRGLAFDDLRRMQFDLETTGLDPSLSRVFLIALRDSQGRAETLQVEGEGDAAEADLIRRFVARVRELDPDVIENHNLHGFDLPFLAQRARLLATPLALGRAGPARLFQRPSSRGNNMGGEHGEDDAMRRMRYTVVGRELIDTMDAVRRYDFATRELPSMGLKAVARHLGIATPTREYVPGARVHEVFLRDPERVRRYAEDDVHEAAGVARLLGGAAFALARMAPRRYERLSDAGAATGVLDPLLVRAYLRAGAALPIQEPSDGTEHQGAALHLFAAGVAKRIVKADVASLYPSLMREYRIGPKRDRLGVLVSLVERLVDRRLEAKAKAKLAAPDSAERHTHEALSAAMKLVVNSAYGYLGAVGLTRFADVHAANEVTRRGREMLSLICRELHKRGVSLLEADTDGVYFSVPESFSLDDERRVIAEVDALLPEHVHLEFDGRYAAMLSHEPKNYALLPYDGPVRLRGVAFRSSRAEPFGEEFLKNALAHLLRDDVQGARDAYVHTASALRRRALPTRDVTTLVRLTKTPEEYLSTQGERKSLAYEALLNSQRTYWSVGERIRVYRARNGQGKVWHAPDEPEQGTGDDARDYDVDYYLRLLRETYAARLARALTPDDFAELVADPEQPTLFAASLEDARPILTVLADPSSLA
jgi:DNA polymerase elongation subunit (family B)